MHLSTIVAVIVTSWLHEPMWVTAVDYCSLCENEPHTMCAYFGLAEKCEPSYENSVSAADKEVIVDTHNKLRSRVASGQQAGQPPAANMRAMVWDDDLAQVAQRWADQCVFGHDKCRDDPRFEVGQNAAMDASTAPGGGANWEARINSWYDEVKDFDPKEIDKYGIAFRGGGVTGHYTQVVWAESYLIGCGYMSFNAGGDVPYTKHYMCNYGPGGNMLGAKIYIRGEGCSKCPAEAATCNAKYEGLCGNGTLLRSFTRLQLVLVFCVLQFITLKSDF